MNRSIKMLQQGAMGIAFAGALGFGATQAFATARLAPPEYICQPNDPSGSYVRCNNSCISRGFTGGQCNGTYTQCLCDS